MNFDGGTVRYNIEVDTSGFTRDLDALDKEFNRLSDKYDALFEKGIISEKDIKKVENLKQELESLGGVLEEAEEGSDEYEYALQQANKAMDEFASTLGETKVAAEETVQPMQSLGSAIANLAGQAGLSALKGLATGATTALVGLAKKGIATTSFLETSQTAMAGLLGSMDLGTKALSKAADFWQNNPFQRTDVTNATKTLVQYGRTVDQLSGDLKILGNVSLSTGMSIDQLSLYYGRVASSGRAMTRDIEMMSQRGVPIYRELGKIMGATTEEVRKFAAEGKVSFDIFKQAMEGAVDPEAMAAYEKTLARQTDRLKGSIAILAGDLAGYKIVNNELEISANGLYETWVKLVNTLATGLRTSGLRDGLTKIGEALGSLLDKIFKFYEVWDEESQKMVQHSATLEKVFDAVGKVVDFLGEHAELLIPIGVAALGVISKLVSQVPIIGSAFGGLSKSLSSLGGILKTFVKGHPIISAFIGLFTIGFVQAYKTSEEFRNNISKLLSSIGTLIKNLLPIITSLVQTFISLATSQTVTTIIETLVSVLAGLAEVLASIPQETLILIVTVIAGLKMAQINPWILYASAIATLALRFRELVKEAGGIGKIFENIKEIFSRFGNALFQAGGDLIAGFVRGITTAWSAVKNGITGLFSNLVTSVKNILGIHSPSTVMYGIGQNVGLGLANGITDSSSVVQKAMNNLASDVLKTAQRVISNMSDFGLIDTNGVYKQWKKVANLFTIGSEQYEQAIEKMEEARKNVNLEIINLQNEYNSKLDETIKKIQTFYDLFDDVSTKGGKNASQIIKNLDKQVAQTAEWAEAQKIISGLDLDPKFIEELKELGVGSVSELSSIANMTASELEQMNTLWLKKQEIATSTATEQLSDYKNDVLKQVSELADGIDGETVSLKDEGGRLVASIGEGITGALPTLAGSMAQLNDYILEAQRELSKSLGGVGQADTGGGGGSEEDKDDPFGIKKMFSQAQDDLEKGASTLGTIAGGLGIATILYKVFKNIGGLDKLASKGGILGGLGKLLGGKGTASTVAGSAQGMGHVDLSGLNKTTSQLGETASTASKVGEWSIAIAKAALAIAAIAVAIAAIAGSIWVMDKALDGIDWGTFISKLGMVVVATVAMGALSYAVSKLNPGQMALGAAVIILLALDVAAIGAAIGLANYAMDGIEWGEFMSNIGMLAVAIVAMGVLAAIAGIGPVALLVATGAVVILALAVDIIAISAAIAYMNAAIPDDIGLVQQKLLLVYEAVAAFEVLTGLAGIFALVEGLGILVVLGIADEIKQVAIAIGLMSLAIPNDLDMVQTKLNFLRDTISLMSESNFGNAIGNVIQSVRIAALEPVINEFVKIAGSMKQLEGINVSRDDVFGIMGALDAIIGSGDTLARFAEVGKMAAQSVATGVQQGLQAIYQAGNQIQTALWQGVQDKFSDEFEQGKYLAIQVRNGIESVISTFQQVGHYIQSNLWQGIQSRFQDEYYQGRAMGERFRQGLYDVDYGNAGWWAVQGFINGAWGRAGSGDGVYHTGWWIANNFLQGLKDRGGQGSPWKTTMQSGVWAAEGLVEGMESMESQVIDEAEVLADGIVNALDLSDTTLTPTLSATALSPSSGLEDEYVMGGGRGVVINNNVTAYTEYDLEQNVRDLSYALSQV